MAFFPLKASFRNSIIFGSRRDEIELADVTENDGPKDVDFEIQFENCIVKVDELLMQQDGLYGNFFGSQCQPCINGAFGDALFVDPNEDDYLLDSLSIAINQGQLIPSITTDLLGNLRDSEPDLGCFERQ